MKLLIYLSTHTRDWNIRKYSEWWEFIDAKWVVFSPGDLSRWLFIDILFNKIVTTVKYFIIQYNS